jgi:hypothetical protein
MEFPTPDDSKQAPVWENYVVAQAAQAALGLIPPSALAVGVRVRGTHVSLVFQLRERASQDADDVQDVTGELEVLLGPNVLVDAAIEVLSQHDLTQDDGIRWFYRSRG